MNRISSARVHAAARQHGAMDHSTPPCDLDEVRRYRLGRIRRALVERDLAGIILYDQVNTRYAVDSTNMQIWCTHNEVRYVYVPAEGPAVLYEWGGKDLLSAGIPTIDEIRPAIAFLYFGTGSRHLEKAREWAADMDSVIREHSGGNRRIAIDRIAPQGVIEMQRHGYEIFDGFEVMENAREIKCAARLRSCASPSRYASRRLDRCARRCGPASRRTHYGPSCTTATLRGAANGSRLVCSPRGRAQTPGFGSARCASSSAATW